MKFQKKTKSVEIPGSRGLGRTPHKKIRDKWYQTSWQQYWKLKDKEAIFSKSWKKSFQLTISEPTKLYQNILNILFHIWLYFRKHFPSALIQETTREAHFLNKSKSRKNGIQETTDTTHVDVGRISQNESKGGSQERAMLQAWRAPDAAGDQRLTERCFQGKEWDRKHMMCLEMWKIYWRLFTILFVNLERINDRYVLLKATKEQLKWDIY